MKNRTDKILLAVFAVTLLLYIFIVLTYLEIIPVRFPLALFSLRSWLTLTFSAVPVFCLQLLLCRRTRRWIAAIPALVIVGAALWFAFGWLTATGWDTLGWAILFWLSIAPAAGCALAWAVFGCWKLCRRGDIRVP